MKTLKMIVPMRIRRYLLMLSGDKRWYVTKRIPNEYERLTRMRCLIYVSDHRMGYEGLSGHICGLFDSKRVLCLKWKGNDWEKRPETDGWDVGYTKSELNKMKGNDLYLWEMTNEEILVDPKELKDFGLTTPPTTWAYLGEETN